MNYVILAVATLLCSAKSIVTKLMGDAAKEPHDMLLMNGVIFLIASVTAGLTGGFTKPGEISTYSLIMAALLAFFLLFTIIMQSYAMSKGPVSLGSLIYSLGFLLPIFYSAAFLGENVSIYQCFGILLVIVSLFIIISPEKGGKISFLWVLLAFLAMAGSGTSGVLQKIHQNTEFKNELNTFVLYSFLFASVLAFIASLIAKKLLGKERYSLFDHKRNIGLIVAGGLVVGFMNLANTFLTGKLPAVVQFPVYNTSSMVISAIFGKIIFGDKLSKRKLIGFVIGLAAVTIIGLT